MEAASRSCAALISSRLTGSADASAWIVFCWFICVTLYVRKRDISTAIRSGVGRKQALCRPDGKNRIYRPWNNGRTHGGESWQGGARRHGFQSLDGEDPGMGGETWRRSSRQSGAGGAGGGHQVGRGGWRGRGLESEEITGVHGIIKKTSKSHKIISI